MEERKRDADVPKHRLRAFQDAVSSLSDELLALKITFSRLGSFL